MVIPSFLATPSTYSRHQTQPGKRAIDLIIDFLRCLWSVSPAISAAQFRSRCDELTLPPSLIRSLAQYAREQITREIGAVADLSEPYLLICLSFGGVE